MAEVFLCEECEQDEAEMLCDACDRWVCGSYGCWDNVEGICVYCVAAGAFKIRVE